MQSEPLAHSAPDRPGATPQLYGEHVENVLRGTRSNALDMLLFLQPEAGRASLLDAIMDAAAYHDLGKLDPEIQQSLRKGRNQRLRWDHVDAGVAHLQAQRARTAAFIVRAHHAPGLPSNPEHFGDGGRKLRGRRRDGASFDEHQKQIARTDAGLSAMLATQRATVPSVVASKGKAAHGLTMRLALSCLVDADHRDTAHFDVGWQLPLIPSQRWAERLDALDRYVAGLKDRGGERDALRRAFYKACREPEQDDALMACEGPVGIGKTTAVTAYLLRRAIATGARRLFIVAPYTAVLSQTAATLRKALLLNDERERPDQVIAEHHHRADFASISSRDLAALWMAPIILTTAVQFFETLAGAGPSSLRKLHMLPGAVIFLDEMHAAVPVSGERRRPSTNERVDTPILPQNWRWLCELADRWSCSLVLASGSLARFWTVEDIVGEARRKIKDLVPRSLAAPMLQAEAKRVRYATLPRFAGPAELSERVACEPGPRLLILNTVQSAAVLARHMREVGHNVLHLSTALCPRDRDLVLTRVRNRLEPERGYPSNWTLVATSLMEAGVDVSFRTCFRERFATASLIQIGGRGNRNATRPEGATIFDFVIDATDGLTRHPGVGAAADVLGALFEEGALTTDQVDPAEIVTRAMKRELRRRGKPLTDHLGEAEASANYPDVESLGRMIDADTRLVVVDPDLRDRLIARERITQSELLQKSVQIWASKIEALALDRIWGRDDVFWFPHDYDSAFLGYMAGVLKLKEMERRGFAIFD